MVVPASGNERPSVNVRKADVTVKRGGKAKVTGTFGDPDGNIVTLKASVGKVTKTGSGSYSWRYRATRRQKTKIVYITATDSVGLKGQIPFRLKVTGRR